MSVGPPAPAPAQNVERERFRIGRLLEEVARLAELDVPATVFYAEMLKRLLDALGAPAGVVWTVGPEGSARIQHQIRMGEVGLASSENGMQSHTLLLQHVASQGTPLHLLPHTSLGSGSETGVSPGNPTAFVLLVVPVVQNGQTIGILEVWQAPNRSREAIPGFLQYMGRVAELVGRYQRGQRMGQLQQQQQSWTQLETFARQVHVSLNPTEVAYQVANEGRRLIDCDRVSVGLRVGRHVRIEAVSGADVVESRSNLVTRMRKLCDRVVQWGERLVFQGVKDDGLPPKVLRALDAYLAESNSKLLVVMPLKDAREEKLTVPPRSVMVMECFDPPEDPQQLISRLEVVGKHATSALYNAAEYRRIPFRFFWLPLARLQEGIGGKTRAIMLAVCLLLTLIGSAFYLVPYPLKMEATGQLLPATRRVIYSPTEGTVRRFLVAPGDIVHEHHVLAEMFDKDLETKVIELQTQITNARREADAADKQAKEATIPADQLRYQAENAKQKQVLDGKLRELEALIERTSADREHDGRFYLKAPGFTTEEMALFAPSRRGVQDLRTWTVLNGSFREEWTNKGVTPADPILRLGAKDGPWEIELRIPQKHIGQILHAYDRLQTDRLDVDFLLRTHPTQVFKGKLPRHRIAGQVQGNAQAMGDEEPTVLAFVQIDDPDIEPEYRLPREMLRGGTVSGAEVHARVRCGPQRLGYVLFYGVWEFFYEKVLFAF